MRIMRSVGLACGLVLFCAGASFAATRYVNATNVTPLAPFTNVATASTNIQAAIDAAFEGDLVLVAPGTYRVSTTVEVNKSLTVRSTQSRAAIIDAQRLCQALWIRGGNSVVEGFIIRNGRVVDTYAGGVNMDSYCTLRDCLVTGNEAWGAGGVFIYEASLVENCTIQSNLATYTAGGLMFYAGTTGLVRNCTISDNIASNFAGGVSIQFGGVLSNCWISGNRTIDADGDAGGVWMSAQGTAVGGTMVNSVVCNNSTLQDGGGIWCGGAAGTLAPIINCTVVSNTAGRYGGGVYANEARMINNIMYFNTAPTAANLYLDTYSSWASNCCVFPMPVTNGMTCFTNAPTFVNRAGGNYRLVAGSSCIDAGTANSAPGNDYDGNPRPVAGTLGGPALYDVGAYEYGVSWDSGYTDIGSGWRRLTWFGDYVPMGGEGWIWHNKHGFFFVPTSSTPQNVWLYAQDMGWLYTSNTLYPFLFRASDSDWLWYNGATNPRWFRNMTANTWESRP